MPLHAHAETLALDLDRLRNAVGRNRGEAHVLAEPLDAAMMARVHLDLARPIEDAREKRPVLDRDGVRRVVQDGQVPPVHLALGHGQAGHVHAQGPAQCDVQDLHAAAGGEQGLVRR